MVGAGLCVVRVVGCLEVGEGLIEVEHHEEEEQVHGLNVELLQALRSKVSYLSYGLGLEELDDLADEQLRRKKLLENSRLGMFALRLV